MSSSAKTVVRTCQNYINGQWVKSSSGEMFPVYDPSTEEVIAHVASGKAADVDSAVKAALETKAGFRQSRRDANRVVLEISRAAWLPPAKGTLK